MFGLAAASCMVFPGAAFGQQGGFGAGIGFGEALWTPENGAEGSEPERARRADPLARSLDEISEPSMGPPSLFYRVRAGTDYAMHAGFSDRGNNGSITFVRARAGVDVIKPFEDRSSLTVGFNTEISFYDWTDNSAFFGTSSPAFDRVHIYNLSATYAKPLDADWTVFGGARVRSAFQDGARFGDTLAYGGLLGASYRVNDDFRVGFGFAGTTRLENTGWIVPIVTVDWQIDDRWRLRNDTGFGFTLSYDVDAQLKLLGAIGFERREFRLDDNEALPRGVVRDTSIPAGLGVDWTSENRKFEVRALAGIMAYQEYRFFDRNGNFAEKSDTKITPVFRLEVGYNF
ncbi:MAG: hypothetical protein EA378_08960 [Phycisphaerales bacterium]|nr:MAG: hypothetical protein EA378_08960 [Phycisphaerales bacterium]